MGCDTSGTSAGVGLGLTLPTCLEHGDVMALGIEGFCTPRPVGVVTK